MQTTTSTAPHRRFIPNRALVSFILIAILTGCSVTYNVTPTHAAAVSVGLGSYNTTYPAGAIGVPGPQSDSGGNLTPAVTSNVTGAIPTNDWWSSLVFKFHANNYSENMFAYPLAFHANAGGLGISYPNQATISTDGNQFQYIYNEDFTLGIAGLNAPQTLVDGYSDWTVTPYWTDGTRTLRATIGHGLPFVYATISGGNAQVNFSAAPSIWANEGNVLGVTVHGHNYGIFGPTGATWSGTTTLQSSLASHNYFSVAVLPDNTQATLDFYKGYAYSFVTGTQVSWGYDQTHAKVNTTYSATTSAKEGTQTGTLLALLITQWQHSSDSLTSYTYNSARGLMKVHAGSGFSTSLTFNGVLPNLPDSGDYNRATLGSEVTAADNPSTYWNFGNGSGTYWTGKALGRLAQLVPIADQLGNTTARNDFLNAMKGKLQDWFQAPDGKNTNVFYYNSTWGTLIGYPAEYGSDNQLNDHHFHYGYYIQAAAMIARYDPTWASQSNWGGMVSLLIKDPANADRSDTRFPFLRNFDPYEGHSWAAGHAGFADGNNQESSSEALNFDSALIEWGAATGDNATRDLGIYLYTTEVNDVEQYWWNQSGQVFPAGYTHKAVGIVWGTGGVHSTWFGADPEFIHGINFLPITANSLYIGRNPAYVTQNFNEILSEVPGGALREWQDIIWEALALGDPVRAAGYFDTTSYTPEQGESQAHTYHWIHNLKVLGNVDTAITADVPTYAVFINGSVITHVAYNATGSTVTVHFSDGYSMSVPARTMVTNGGGGGPTPTNTPTSTPTNTPTNTPPGPTNTPTNTPTRTPTPTNTPTSGGCAGSNSTLYVRSGAQLCQTAGSSAGSDSISSAGGGNYDGTPHNPNIYTISGLTGSYNSGATAFNLYVDAGTGVGDGVQMQVQYDFTGDGTWDRTETYNYFATNPVTDWENYDQSKGVKSSSGSFAAMSNGKVRIQVWNAIGNSATSLRVDASSGNGQQSRLVIPYTLGSNPTPTPTPGGCSSLGAGAAYVLSGGQLCGVAGSTASSDTISSAGGANYDGTPHNPSIYTLSGVNGSYQSSGASAFNLYMDAGTNVGDGVQVQVQYDFTGDGIWDRTETYNYFATDPVTGWESYDQNKGIETSSGTFASTMSGGKVRIQVWNAIGNSATSLRVNASASNGQQSKLVIPYR